MAAFAATGGRDSDEVDSLELEGRLFELDDLPPSLTPGRRVLNMRVFFPGEGVRSFIRVGAGNRVSSCEGRDALTGRDVSFRGGELFRGGRDGRWGSGGRHISLYSTGATVPPPNHVLEPSLGVAGAGVR